MTPQKAASILRDAGFEVDPLSLRLERREELWVMPLSGDRIAWFSTTSESARLLAFERRVQELVSRHTSLCVPVSTFMNDVVEVRNAVPGLVDHGVLFKTFLADSSLAQRFGHELGHALADLHGSIPASQHGDWLPKQLEWPLPHHEVIEKIDVVIDDPGLVAQIDHVLTMHETIVVDPSDLVLLHGDLGFHNVAVEYENLAFRGLFDFKDAARADRHLDFRYLIFTPGRFDMLDACCAEYSRLTGRTLDQQRIKLYNAIWAISHLAHRAGTAPDELSCGRTLERDLWWTRSAIASLSA
ncbi:hypothetical protein AM1_A0175 (plasmid) [Acaryochloris marina MBIC11017]|uniref:Aminoglycoside phosphotransferase domain-containing protein n=2 Tax=Acaryochloris marina TaxID=155978 RepID=A8ZKI2_ACAM1|nr:hypothetical protein AM1_A0175 [Acaryochloris marina MBIC11017]